MSNYLITVPSAGLFEVQKKIREALPGLDAQLFAISASQAILTDGLVREIKQAYPHLANKKALTDCGALDVREISEEATINFLNHRDPASLLDREQDELIVDPKNRLWHVQQSKADKAWKMLGSVGNIDWKDVKVGLIDTGYTRHPAFGFPKHSWIDTANARTFIDDGSSSAGDLTHVSTEQGGGLDNAQEQFEGHGTRIGATICGFDPKAPGGAFYGIAPKVPLIPARITKSVWINDQQPAFAQAMRHLVRHAGARVVNISLGVVLGKVSGELKRAINLAYEAGVIVICAAGNLVPSVVAPARLSRTVAVGGATRNKRPWSGSSRGVEVDFSSHAAGIWRASTERSGAYVYGGGGDGTSYATAITSGAAALWLAHHGKALDDAYPLPWQRVEAFLKLARDTADPPAAGWPADQLGRGILDIQALLQAPLPDSKHLLAQGPA